MKGREERKTDKCEIEGREGNTKDKQGRKERLEGRDKDVGRAAKGREEEERLGLGTFGSYPISNS